MTGRLLLLATALAASPGCERPLPAVGAPPAGAAPGPAATAAPAVRVLRRGKALDLAPPARAALVAEAEALFASCTDRDRRSIEDEDWASARAAGAVEFEYASAVELASAARGPTRVSALLVPVDGGAFAEMVLARDGDTIWSPFLGGDAARRAAVRAAVE